MMKIKKILKNLIPNIFFILKNNYQIYLERKKFSNMNLKDIFKEIYVQKMWSSNVSNNEFKFYSGLGSHNSELTNEYLDKVIIFLKSFQTKPNIVDLGCGDFIIGSKLRNFCGSYIAIDIFDELIEYNKKKYKNIKVDFRALDITKDDLPTGDICLVRQVLQHLSNNSILNFLKLIQKKYKYLILTEHFPEDSVFTANVDKPDGADIRMLNNSAVVLTKAPFNLKVQSERILCEVKPQSIKNFQGSLKTFLFKL